MTYSKKDDNILLGMTQEEFSGLLLMAGYAAGAATKGNDKQLAYRFLSLANKINEGNPNWTPYKITSVAEA